MTFRMGQKVICIWKTWEPRSFATPQIGKIYTVLQVTMGRTLQGLVLAELPTDNNLGWVAERFRPIRRTQNRHIHIHRYAQDIEGARMNYLALICAMWLCFVPRPRPRHADYGDLM